MFSGSWSGLAVIHADFRKMFSCWWRGYVRGPWPIEIPVAENHSAGRICRSQEVFATREGSISSNLGARFFWSQDTGQTNRFNVEVLFIHVLMCCEMFWYVLYMLDLALLAFLYPQSTMPPCAASSRDQWISKATFGRLGFLLNQNLPSFTLLGLIKVRLTMVYQLNCGLGLGMFLIVRVDSQYTRWFQSHLTLSPVTSPSQKVTKNCQVYIVHICTHIHIYTPGN